MGRTLANKKEIVAEIQELLSEAQLALVIDYKGVIRSGNYQPAESPAD
jgi:large subunit ribosomal protein L10